MTRSIPLALACIAVIQVPTAMACGFQGAAIPLGTPIQELAITGRDRPTMNFGAAPVTRASVVARACHGTLTVIRPAGFRYVPAAGFVGRDAYAVKGCLANGHCDITGAVVTVGP